MSKTFRRDRLLKLARDGRLVCIEGYNFDDQLGTNLSQKEYPVRVRKRFDDFLHGWYNMTLNDFQSRSGSASQKDDGTVTLYVHSNRNMTFRILQLGQKAQLEDSPKPPEPPAAPPQPDDEKPKQPSPNGQPPVKITPQEKLLLHNMANRAKVLFDQLTEASYMGMQFRIVLFENPAAMNAAQALVDAMKAGGVNLTTPDWVPPQEQ